MKFKPILPILLLLCSVGRAQTKKDTVPCLMLVNDTAWAYGTRQINNGPIDTTNKFRIEYTGTIRGFEVSQKEYIRQSADCSGCQHWYTQHDAYLDADKKPLKLFVWMSKTY